MPDSFTLPSIELGCGLVRPSDTVELVDDSGRESTNMLSGDFLRVKETMEYTESEEVKLRGELFRRNAYHRPLFDHRLPGNMNEMFMLKQPKNEVFMLNSIQVHSKRPISEEGLVDVDPDQVVRKWGLLITNLRYPAYAFQDCIMDNWEFRARLRGRTKDEQKNQVFNHGRLVCRWI